MEHLQRGPEAMEPWRQGNAATTLSRGGELPIIGAVIMNLTLLALDGRKVRVKAKFRIVAAGHLRYYGLVIGMPTLEAAPLGWGFRPAIGSHVFAGLGICCARLEDDVVQQAVEGVQVALLCGTMPGSSEQAILSKDPAIDAAWPPLGCTNIPISYTHLTLPTIYSV